MAVDRLELKLMLRQGDALVWFAWFLVTLLAAVGLWPGKVPAEEPAAINPFKREASPREDALPGSIELSDGSTQQGLIYLTRDKRLQIYDEKLQRQREVPLSAVRQIDCHVKREWMEKEWRFKETTSDEKVYTGRSYPARDFFYTVTLKDGRTIEGAMSRILYLEPKRGQTDGAADQERSEPKRFLLQKRSKGEPGQELKSLIYVKKVRLNDE